jgi:ABC-2 type transport system permease protein
VSNDGAVHAMPCRLWRPSWRASCYKFSRQYGRLVSAVVRPLLWLAVFAAGFRNVFGVAIAEPYDTYIPYDVYIAPGLVGMVLLFNGMQSAWPWSTTARWG